MYKNAEKYFKKHLVFHGLVHFIGGLGLGLLLAQSVFFPHQVLWGASFIILALLGHLYALKGQE